MKNDNRKIIVFQNKVLQYTVGNAAEKEAVLDYMRSVGIPEEQFGWEE